MSTVKQGSFFDQPVEEPGGDQKGRIGTFVETAFSNEEIASAIAQDAHLGIQENNCAFLQESMNSATGTTRDSIKVHS